MASIKLGFENKLLEAANKLRGNIEESDYKHIVLGLIFLKYISDSFNERYNEIKEELGEEFLELKDSYTMKNVFFVPEKARWDYIKQNAKTPEIGKIIDDAMYLIENENPELKNVLPKDYARPEIDKIKLGELVDIFTFDIGGQQAKANDILGRVYEYFLGHFGSTEGEFYTPPSIVKLLVELIEPYKGRVYDPCCGSGGMFVQSAKFIEEHQGNLSDISVYGQEYTATTWRLAKMNLAIRKIEGNLGPRDGDTFGNDFHKRLKADYILANPPFNIKDWGQERLLDDPRWKYGIPPANSANYAWIQHMISKLSSKGKAAFVMANGALSTMTKEEAEIRKNIVEDRLVDAIIAMPSQLFYTTGIPVSLWVLNKDKSTRKDEILFIDARNMGEMVTRRHRELSSDEISEIANTYHSWKKNDKYEDINGYCASISIEEVSQHDYILTPGRYVGLEDEEDDGVPFEEKMETLTTELRNLFDESKELEEKIKENLRSLGYEL